MVVVVCVCVGGGGGAISKLKGAGATHALPRSYMYLHVSILLCASFHINHLCSTKAKPPRNNRKAFKGE